MLALLPIVPMLTGYNTDIDRGDLVVHVQTEDKGLANPYVDTLIYVGGRVVASKSSTYADQLADGADEAVISRFMDQQHRKIVMAIRSGRLDDRIRRVAAAKTDRSRETSAAVVTEPMAQGAPAPPCTLELHLSSEIPLVAGETVVVWIRAAQGDQPAADVEIRAELVSTLQTPVLLASGVTDVDGLYKSDLVIPDVEAGTGAVIFRGRCDGSIAELIELL